MHFCFKWLSDNNPEVCRPITIHPVQNRYVTCYFAGAQHVVSQQTWDCRRWDQS